MKHTLKITIILVFIFFFTQVMGLIVTNKYIDHMTTEKTGNVTWVALPLEIERPQIQESQSYWYIAAAILIGTILVLILVKTQAFRLWKLWFFLAVTICLTISFAAYLQQYIAVFLAFIFALWKIFRPNVYVHNLTEMLIYGGLAAILVPVINITAMFILLVFISLYDMYAVWHSKHMIAMAKFQTQSKMFAGLLIPYKPKIAMATKKPALKAKYIKNIKKGKENLRSAILGGGDIGFPLIFAGVVMKGLMLQNPVYIGFLKTLIIPVFVSIALLILLVKSDENKFYPAMPFLSIGCLAGYMVILLIG